MHRPTINDVVHFTPRGPWTTKAGGQLSVLFALPYDVTQQFFDYDPEEIARIPEDIRGMRCYATSGVTPGTISGTEFHRIRKEIFFCTKGEFSAELEDIAGQKATLALPANHGVYIPPFTMHSFLAKETSEFFVLANTLFNPQNTATHDTYSQEIFAALQQQYRRESL